MVSEAVFVVPAKVAETVTVWFDETGRVVIANVADVAPDATVTEGGTVAAAELELIRVTELPDGPA